MSAGHTPGPWGMETVRTSCGVCHKVGPWPHKWRAGETMSACIYDDYPSPPEGTDTMLANARLIAAAPDLLEAAPDAADLLERYAAFIRDNVKADDLEMHPYLPSIEDTARGLRAAIARATGEQP